METVVDGVGTSEGVVLVGRLSGGMIRIGMWSSTETIPFLELKPKEAQEVAEKIRDLASRQEEAPNPSTVG